MPPSPLPLRYINSLVAQQIDDILMSPSQGAFTLDQLVELAGQACAMALARTFPLSTSEGGGGKEKGGKFKRVLVAAGPGNQGLDGLAAARHLCGFARGGGKEGELELTIFPFVRWISSHYQLTSATTRSFTSQRCEILFPVRQEEV